MAQDDWLHGFNYNVEEWFEGDHYDTLAICRSLAIAHATFRAAIRGKADRGFMILSRTRGEATRRRRLQSADANALHLRLAREMSRLALQLDLDLADSANLGRQ